MNAKVTVDEMPAEQKERWEKAQVAELPKGYVPLKDALAVCAEHKVPVARLVKAMGRDQLVDAPLSKEFAPVYYKGKRYLPAAVLKAIPVKLAKVEKPAPKATATKAKAKATAKPAAKATATKRTRTPKATPKVEEPKVEEPKAE